MGSSLFTRVLSFQSLNLQPRELSAGDADGCNEMTYSLEYLRKFLIMFQMQDTAQTTRVFFPDKAVRSHSGLVPVAMRPYSAGRYH